MPANNRMPIFNCPVSCEYSLNDEKGFIKEQALNKDGIMVIEEDLFPESTPLQGGQSFNVGHCLRTKHGLATLMYTIQTGTGTEGSTFL